MSTVSSLAADDWRRWVGDEWGGSSAGTEGSVGGLVDSRGKDKAPVGGLPLDSERETGVSVDSVSW